MRCKPWIGVLMVMLCATWKPARAVSPSVEQKITDVTDRKKDPEVRLEAIRQLAQVSPEDAKKVMPVLFDLAGDLEAPHAIQQQAEIALANMGDRAVAFAAQRLRSRTAADRLTASKILWGAAETFSSQDPRSPAAQAAFQAVLPHFRAALVARDQPVEAFAGQWNPQTRRNVAHALMVLVKADGKAFKSGLLMLAQAIDRDDVLDPDTRYAVAGFLSRHADLPPNVLQAAKAIQAEQERGNALVAAVMNRDPAQVKKLLADGVDPNARAVGAGPGGLFYKRSLRGNPTALMVAAGQGNAETVRLLLKHGADVDAHNLENYHTALSLAETAGHKAVAELLIKAGAKKAPPSESAPVPDPQP